MSPLSLPRDSPSLLLCIWGRCTGISHRQFCSQTMCIRILLLAVILAAHQHVMVVLAPRSVLGQAPAALQETQLLETPSQFLVQWVRPYETTTHPPTAAVLLGRVLGCWLCCMAVTKEAWWINVYATGRVCC